MGLWKTLIVILNRNLWILSEDVDNIFPFRMYKKKTKNFGRLDICRRTAMKFSVAFKWKLHFRFKKKFKLKAAKKTIHVKQNGSTSTFTHCVYDAINGIYSVNQNEQFSSSNCLHNSNTIVFFTVSCFIADDSRKRKYIRNEMFQEMKKIISFILTTSCLGSLRHSVCKWHIIFDANKLN